ncbi:MAG: class I SAM-dependent methyltransferase [Chloroflexi bacterium]|jgi:SAM-dependent methyltransferase|nr:MAG: class I SAM-dependent methyltransferase [Chloroflexota bacterium]
MPDFAHFDARGYRTVDVRSGYAEWVPTYEATVAELMDIALLKALTSVPWASLRSAADLGCGTGRTGAWLRRCGVDAIDGVDLTPEMLAVARKTGVYRRLAEADVAESGLKTGAYDLVTVCLVDEHLPDLSPLYGEAWRLAKADGLLVLVGFHPHIIMASGMPTHFQNAAGEQVAIETHVHLLSEHATAGLSTGWRLVEMKERLVDDDWLEVKPSWERFRGHPLSFAFVWRRPSG